MTFPHYMAVVILMYWLGYTAGVAHGRRPTPRG